MVHHLETVGFGAALVAQVVYPGDIGQVIITRFVAQVGGKFDQFFTRNDQIPIGQRCGHRARDGIGQVGAVNRSCFSH
jgi:hypothetical protein